VSVPHCIAHQLRISGNEQDAAELPKKGAVGEGWVWIAPDLVDYSLTALVVMAVRHIVINSIKS
jgi:hypothetical protein